MLTTGAALTIIVLEAMAVQPAPLDPVTVYVVVTVGDTAILADVAPLLQTKDPAPLAVRITEAPGQIEDTEASMLITGATFTVIVFETTAEQPFDDPVTE